MIAITEEEMPLTIVWKKLGDEDATLDVIMVDVPIDPPMFEVRVLLDEERVLLVLRVVIVAEAEVRLVIVVVAKVVVPITTKPPVEVEEERLDRKLVFSSHSLPSQYSVE